MKQEIERHLQDKETLENSLPSSIVIGPYWISTEGVRQALAKKRKALANAVIELLAKKLRKQADMVCNILTVVNTHIVWGTVIFIILLIIYIGEVGTNARLGYYTLALGNVELSNGYGLMSAEALKERKDGDLASSHSSGVHTRRKAF